MRRILLQPKNVIRIVSFRKIGEASKYEKKSAMEHVLIRPDTYIGGIGMRENAEIWNFDRKIRKMHKTIGNYPPGLLKIFDEILVNSADNKIRDKNMDRLEVTVDRETNRISVWNNGRGLPVEIHPKEGVYVPTLVFGNLFTSSNYDDNEIKTVGGRNGYGAKLCNIFSKEFIVETVDKSRNLKFRQRWYENMQKFDEPIIEVVNDPNLKDYTKVEFIPDLSRFNLESLSDDIISLIQKRVFDVSATLPRGVTVVFNKEKVNNEAGFEGYIKSFIPENNSILFLHPNSRWHIGITKRKMELENENGNGNEEDIIMPESMSFVNNINTEKGGTHVDHVFDKIISILKKVIDEKMENSGFRVKPANIKNNISIFINSLIENPSFESQTKETLTTKSKFFGSSFEVDQRKLINWANECGLIEEIMENVMNLKKKKTKKTRVGDFDFRDIVKLEDAILAGNKEKSQLCTLIVTEGDSAKALALSGLEILGREKFGVFPLKGKLINVSNLDEKKASENEEISTLMRIIGLKFGVENFEEMNLRYGKLMILADQDEDGSHIKGLIINFIHKFWPDLLKNGFIQSFRTPLLKAKRGKEVHCFFNHQEFENWQKSQENSGKYTIKYYKGLGTSTSEEARQYFKDIKHHIIDFKYENSEDDFAIRMAFDREKSDERKEWIKKYSEKSEKEINNNLISYKEFVDEDLMKFGIVDLRRSIPCLIDGLKPSQRKILWTLLSMEDSKEMKVSQLSGAVSHSQSYHHGEESLVRTIIRMAQKYCGSSNLNLLEPIGQFGTRHENGNDAASARYIYTKLAPPTRLLFPSSDYSLLNRRFEDGQIVEPEYLCPIIPIVLINGVEGIGTGWNTRIMNRNLFEIIEMTRKMIEDSENFSEFHNVLPFYEGYNGKIEKLSTNRFLSRGIARIWKPERKNASSFVLEISELPIGMWTSKYKEKLQKILENFDIIEFTEHHTEKKANFRIVFDRRRIKSAELLRKTNSELIKIFKLSSTMTENLVLFNSFGKLEEFENIHGIAMQFFEIRKNLYEKRKEMLENQCLEKLKYAENQMRFIEMVTNGTIDLRKINRFELEEIMKRMNFEKDPNKKKSDFGYLLEIPLYRLTPEEMNRLLERKNKKETELDEIKNNNWKNIWMKELDRFENSIIKYRSD